MNMTAVCYIRKDKKTLMLHRTKKENDISKEKWLGLGGKLEAGETPEECIIREVEEESGILIKNPRLRGMIMYPNFSGNGDEFMFVFTADEFDGEVRDCSEGNLVWIEDERITSLNIWEGDKLFFKWIKQGKFFSAKMIYEKGDFVSYQVVFY